MSSRKSKRQPTLVATPKKVAPKPKAPVKKIKDNTPTINTFFRPTKVDPAKPTLSAAKRKNIDAELESPTTSVVLASESETLASLEEYDPARQEQELRAAKKQKWLKEFMAGKELHPFFLQVSKPSAPSSPQQKSVSHILKPMAASLPGRMYYPSLATQMVMEQRKSSKESIFFPELKLSTLELTSQGVYDQVSHDKEVFYFPVSHQAWFELFKQFDPSLDIDSRCYHDFFFDSVPATSAYSGNWLKSYGATSSKHFLGNQKTIAEIRGWLENWKVIACSQDVSDDELILDLPLSDDDSDYGKKSKKPLRSKRQGSKKSGQRKRKPKLPPITILSGPAGVGKTAIAHACAQDCGYRVLEINATSARTGSDLINLVEQLSKNHLVNSSNSFFKSKDASNAPKPNLLILIDEADLLFQGEKSFLTALFHLAASTRRPFILTVNDCTSSFNVPKSLLHANFRLQQAPIESLTTFLQLMCLNEHLILPQPLAHTLIKFYNGDFRKIVLELELISRIQTSTSPSKSAADAIVQFFPSMTVDTSFLDFFPEQKRVTLLSTPHKLLGQEKTDPISPHNLHTYLGDHFLSIHNPNYGWASTSHCQDFPYSYSDPLWPRLPIDDSSSLDSYSHMIDSLSYCDTLEPSTLELDFLQSPETCLLPPSILDEDEIIQAFNPIKPHCCPNKPTSLSSSSFIHAESRYIPSLKLEWKNTYFSEAIREASIPKSDLLEVALGGYLGNYHKKLLHSALKSASPTNRPFSFNENVCTSLPYFSLLIKKEGMRTSRLRSKKILTSKLFPNSSSSQLATLIKYGGFNHPAIAATPASTPSDRSNSLGSDSDASSQDFFPRRTFADQ
ncbi:hypothetical protein DSO57_1036923 [Entomophthora muscae]|uniref:Uncharacterized protein n=1 Tax=Entomophthora muscae TaxID=34485 RepID=A0ACC2SCJ0_9FUNG|nr:hypothetical protein DSO57_1036923 [Entomophthora muscae]